MLVGLLLLFAMRLSVMAVLLLLSAGLAFLLLPLAKRLERHVPKTWAALLTVLSFFGVVVLLFCLLIPTVFREFNDFLSHVPDLAKDIGALLGKLRQRLEPLSPQLAEKINSIGGVATDKALFAAQTIISRMLTQIPNLLWMVATPFLTVYFLRDRNYFTDISLYLFPKRMQQDVQLIARKTAVILRQFLRGQVIVSLAVGALTTAGLFALRVRFPLILGLVMTVCNLIPCVGPFLGTIPIALFSIVKGPFTFFLAMAVVIGVQQIDALILSPRIIGDSVRVHPAFVVLLVLAGNELFGLWGLMLAMPAFILIRTIVIHTARRLIEKKTAFALQKEADIQR